MYGSKFNSLNGGNILDQGTLNWGKQCIFLAMAGIIKSECKKTLD
jgi:hypothetical protein